MVAKKYIPSRGDIVSLQFNPQSGKEQSGRRPAVILSPRSYNGKVGLALCCPVTKVSKSYPFEVHMPKSCKTTGVILADHIKNLDFRTRNIRFLERLPKKQVIELQQKVQLLVE